MNTLIKNTFGGLSSRYYLRQIFFGLLLSTLYIVFVIWSGRSVSIPTALIIAIHTFLYPYSRFAYETLISFFIGDNVFLVNAIFMLIIKFITMMLCWGFAIFIAPFSLAYLYYRNSKLGDSL